LWLTVSIGSVAPNLQLALALAQHHGGACCWAGPAAAATVPATIVVAHANLGSVADGLLAELYLLAKMFASSGIRDLICFTLRDGDLLCCWL